MVDSDGGGKVSAELSDPAYDFDPLREFYGKWNVRLAERYLPMPELFGAAKYECDAGRLVVTPVESLGNSFAEVRLISLLEPAVRCAGLFLASRATLTFETTDWIESDINVLNTKTWLTWVPAKHFVMPIEVVSPSSHRRDKVDKPARCAEAGVPYFMTVDLDLPTQTVVVQLRKLDAANGTYSLLTEATSGQMFTMTEPFEVSFDPARLLD